MNIQRGFTLAEVLITLGIIGVVSAMTLSSLVSNYQYKALDTKKTLFENRLEEAMNQMRFHEKLTGYDDAEGFVAELGKYLKINETCDVSDMSDCFPSITINSCDNEVDTEKLTYGTDFTNADGDNDFSSENIGVVFADGTKAIVNYDLNCEWLNPYDGGANRSEATQCVAMIADVSGNSGKNTVGSDIVAVNTFLGVYVGDVCWDLYDTSYTTANTCDGNNQYDSDCTTSSGCSYCSSNNWAGALEACDLAGKRLP
ncbi:MAG: type II secretion system protein, partial [Candidatus Gastranaerophilales bacterium]